MSQLYNEPLLEKFKGIIVAMPACYDAEGNIDEQSVKRLSTFLYEKGVTGLYVGGSTGEGFLQSIDERKKVLEAVVSEVGGKLTIIAQVGALSTKDSVTLAEHANELKIDAISAVPPFYYSVSEYGAEQHWEAIIRATNLPFIIYNIPATTGFTFSQQLIQKMIAHPQVIGMKITSPSSYELQQIKAAGGEQFLVFNGPDEQLIAGRVMGADAGIGGTYGIMPELYIKIEESFRLGEIEKAVDIQFGVNEVIADLLAMPIYAAIKEVLRLRGVSCGVPRMPLEGLDVDQQEKVKVIWTKIKKLIEVYA